MSHYELESTPDKRDEPVTGAPAVFGIAGQIAAEDFFLVQQSENDYRDEENEDRQCDERAERQRHLHVRHHGQQPASELLIILGGSTPRTAVESDYKWAEHPIALSRFIGLC